MVVFKTIAAYAVRRSCASTVVLSLRETDPGMMSHRTSKATD